MQCRDASAPCLRSRRPADHLEKEIAAVGHSFSQCAYFLSAQELGHNNDHSSMTSPLLNTLMYPDVMVPVIPALETEEVRIKSSNQPQLYETLPQKKKPKKFKFMYINFMFIEIRFRYWTEFCLSLYENAVQAVSSSKSLSLGQQDGSVDKSTCLQA